MVLTNTGSDRVRAVRALSRRQARRRERSFVAEGPQVVREAVRHRPDGIRALYAVPDLPARLRPIVAEAVAAGVPVQQASPEVLAAMGDTGTPQGLLAVCATMDATLESVLDTRPRLLAVLAHVRDPGNAGTVIRAADAAGADAVLISDASVEVYNPKVVRSTAGSLFHLPVVTGVPVGEALRALREAGMAVLAADGHGDSVLGHTRTDLAAAHAWVLGNEAWGLDPHVVAACDEVVRVPVYGLAESLNLAMAATVCLYASAAAAHEPPVIRGTR
jgi:TrmH family RNA methyltransferase